MIYSSRSIEEGVQLEAGWVEIIYGMIADM
jgi:hypothetical protein